MPIHADRRPDTVLCMGVSRVIAEILETSTLKDRWFTLAPPVSIKKPPAIFMLEHWYKEKRTLVDFRRGPLGAHFDAFAAYLKAKGYSRDWGKGILSRCCEFNAFLIERGITACGQVSDSLIEPFLEVYLVNTRTAGTYYSPKIVARGVLKLLFRYLVEIKAVKPPKRGRSWRDDDKLLSWLAKL